MWRYIVTNDDAASEFFHQHPFGEDEEDEEGEEEEEEESYEEESEDDEDEKEPRILEGWEAIPDIILEDIFSILTPKHRHQSSMVCRRWYNIFYSPRVRFFFLSCVLHEEAFYLIGLISLFNGISTVMVYLIQKSYS